MTTQDKINLDKPFAERVRYSAAEFIKIFTGLFKAKTAQAWAGGYPKESKPSWWESVSSFLGFEKSTTGGHYELNSIFANSAALNDMNFINVLNRTSDKCDEAKNQLFTQYHSMYDERYTILQQAKEANEDAVVNLIIEEISAQRQETINGFVEKFERGVMFYQMAQKENVQIKEIYQQQAAIELGTALHVLSDYYSHFLRGKAGSWQAHLKGFFDPSISPDNPNTGNNFDLAKIAVEYAGSLFKDSARKLDKTMLEKLFL